MPRALLSVTDKAGVAEFASFLAQQGYELVSTGGTAKALREAGLEVKDVAQITGFPEMLDGRVKTLHPMVHGGVLADLRSDDHIEQLKNAGIAPIDLVCVNLYAFEKTVTQPHELEEAVESIDIGGPTMVRAAAKNFANVTIVVDPADYPIVQDAIQQGTLKELRQCLAAKAFRHTAFYDSMVSRYLTNCSNEQDAWPTELTFGFRKSLALRYGENPHQSGALYIDPLGDKGIASAVQLWGKELSYNNILDSDGAWELVCDMPPNSCAIIKHGNPCGAAVSGTFAESYRLARKSDPVSAFGGIAAVNGTLDKSTAEAMTEKGNFLEVVISSSFTAEAIEVFKNRDGWGQNVRLLQAPAVAPQESLALRSVRGGVLIMPTDEDPSEPWSYATAKKPTDQQLQDLKLAWAIIPHVKSNAIIIVKNGRLIGVGAGQMNRVQSVRIALEQAGTESNGAVLASDAFFPFPDSVEVAAGAKIASIVQPGGSKKDSDVIEAANRLGISMAMTGTRHFRH